MKQLFYFILLLSMNTYANYEHLDMTCEYSVNKVSLQGLYTQDRYGLAAITLETIRNFFQEEQVTYIPFRADEETLILVNQDEVPRHQTGSLSYYSSYIAVKMNETKGVHFNLYLNHELVDEVQCSF